MTRLEPTPEIQAALSAAVAAQCALWDALSAAEKLIFEPVDEDGNISDDNVNNLADWVTMTAAVDHTGPYDLRDLAPLLDE